MAAKFTKHGVPFIEVYLDDPKNEALRASLKDRGMMSTPIVEELGVGIWPGYQPAVVDDIVKRHGTK